MAEDQIDVLHIESLERTVNGLHEILAVERVALVGPVVEPPEKLGRDDIAGTAPAGALENLAHDDFRLTASVGLGVVEEVDACIIGGDHAFVGRVDFHLGAKRDPGAK